MTLNLASAPPSTIPMTHTPTHIPTNDILPFVLPQTNKHATIKIIPLPNRIATKHAPRPLEQLQQIIPVPIPIQHLIGYGKVEHLVDPLRELALVLVLVPVL